MIRDTKYLQYKDQGVAPTSLPRIGVVPTANNLEEWIEQMFYGTHDHNFISSLSFNPSDGNLTLTNNDTSSSTIIVNLDGRYLQGVSGALGDLQALTSPSVANQFIVSTGAGAFGYVSEATARTALALGSMATQDATAVAITGGTIAGITDLAVADGGTGASTASAARTNLGIGTIGELNSINNNNWVGADLVVENGGTGLSTIGVGEILYGSATDTFSPLAVGTDGHVLTLVAGLPVWQAAPSGQTLGTADQIPYMNAGGTDFDYSSGLLYDGTDLTLTGVLNIGAVTYPNTDGTSGQVLTTDGLGTLTFQNTTNISFGSQGEIPYVNVGRY